MEPLIAAVAVSLVLVIFAELLPSWNRHFHTADAPGRGMLRLRRRLLLGGLSDPKTVRPRQSPSLDEVPLLVEDDVLASVAFPDRATSPTPPYDVDNCLLAALAFRHSLFFFVYDSSSDSFVAVHNAPGCSMGCERISRVGSVVAHALRRNFPGRFRPEGGDLAMMLSVGDIPRVRRACLRGMMSGEDGCRGSDFAPILHFGSVFADPAVMPSVVAMPLPVRPHITCFGHWQAENNLRAKEWHGRGERSLFYIQSTGGKDSSVCQDLQPRIDFGDDSRSGGLVFAGEGGRGTWNNLVPQVVWRGTDFSFLPLLFPDMRAPSFELDIKPNLEEAPQTKRERTKWAIETLWNMKPELLPRWRAVLLTSMAEMETAEYEDFVGERRAPWANMKFVSVGADGEKVPALEYLGYRPLSKIGIAAAANPMNLTHLAGFRYHIDIGGGGGTTWTGTIEKLALPGLLFHHVTPMKDWFHDLLVPWTHYVPVQTDLGDLRERFEWAEANSEEARRIAESATSLARWMGSAEGFAQLYENHLISPLRNVMSAYRSLPQKYGDRSLLDVILAGHEMPLTAVVKCSGLVANSCQKLV